MTNESSKMVKADMDTYMSKAAKAEMDSKTGKKVKADMDVKTSKQGTVGVTSKVQNTSTSAPKELSVGSTAPAFKLMSAEGEVALKDYRGRKVVLYFYPQDMTPTCTEQACQFRDYYREFQELGVEVLGVSPDAPERHARFSEKYTLPFPLLSDPKHKVAEKYGVWQLKKLYGREYMGIVRSTFLINEKGKIAAIWRNVRLKGHLDKVLDELKKMK